MCKENSDTLCPEEPKGDRGDGADCERLFSARQLGLAFAVFSAAAAACHWLGFSSLLVYDGAYFINSKEPVFAHHDVLGLVGIVPARPLFLFTYYLNYLVTGMDPFFFRLTNALICAGSGVVLSLTAMMVFQLPGVNVPGTRRAKQWTSLFLGLLFVVHPLQSFVVLYVWQREAAMACLFYFSSLAAYLAVRSNRITNPAWGYFLTSSLFLAGMLSKENLATLPAALLLAECTILRQTLRQAFRRALLIAAIILPSVIAYLVITNALHQPHSELVRGVAARLLDHYTYGGVSIPEVLMTQCRVFFSYVFMMLFPFARDVEFMRAEIISRSLLNPPVTLAAVCGVIALLGSALVLIKRSPAVSFGILFMFLSLLPESLLIPQYLFFGYRAILPMAGLLLIAGVGILFAGDGLQQRVSAPVFRPAAAVALLVPLAVFASVTALRASRWDHLSFWQDLADRLPRYSKEVETIPFLDISVNCMSTLVDAHKHEHAIELFRRVLAVDRSTGAAGPEKSEVARSVDAFLSVFKDQKMRSGGALIALGAALQLTGRIADSKVAFEKAIHLEPHHTDVHLTLGAMLEDEGKLADAMVHYRKAIEVDPGNAQAYNCLGNALHREGNLRDAAEAYFKAVHADPYSWMGYVNLGRVYQEAGYYREAVDEYMTAIQVDPASAEAYHGLGRAMAETGNVTDAEVNYRKALELNPDLAEVHTDLALALEAVGRLTEAIEHHDKAARLNPDSPVNYVLLGRALRMAGRTAEAIAVLRTAVESAPDQASAHHHLGAALARSRDLPSAVKHLGKAVELDPANPDAYADLARVRLDQGRIANAIELLKTAIALDPNFSVAYTYLGKALEAAGDSQLAKEQFKKAIQLQPDSAEAHYESANRLLRHGDSAAAIKGYREALKINPNQPNVRANMAVALLHERKIPQAIVEIAKALSLNEQSTEVMYALGLAFHQMNDAAGAGEYFKEALRLDPGNREVIERLQRRGGKKTGVEGSRS
ncbi:MAG: tetratricopeptide repeat protein [Desulfomonilaceae bacterium]|nr:tetratricopeptide repeat protein [Desulfomonilaceae bacterium]